MATTTESKKMIRLRSDDGEEFEIEESVAKQFRTNSKKHVGSSSSKVIKYSKKMITLCSSDDEEFEIEERVAREFQAIKHLIKDDCVISVPNVNSKALSKVIEYAKKHVGSSSSKSDEKTADEELKAWDAEFIIKVDRDMLWDLIKAAYHLDIKSLSCLAGGRWFSREEYRKVLLKIKEEFDKKKKFTSEEDEQVGRES